MYRNLILTPLITLLQMSAFTNTDPEAITKAGPLALESSGLIKQLEVIFPRHLIRQPFISYTFSGSRLYVL